jgi:DNA repair protein RadD
MRKHRRFFLAMKLRNYQKKALAKAHCWFKEETTYPLIVLPTGAGKTVVFTTLIKELYLANPEKRFLILAHRQELISQAVDKLLTVWPDAPVGILAASLKKFNQTAPIVVASRDTLASKKRLEKSYPFDYIIIDEAHHVGPQMSSRYRKIIDHFEEIGCPKIMGVTATPYRMGQGYIYGMDDHFFGGIAYKATIPSLIKQGYLSRLSSFKVNNDAVIDASKARVKFKGGDYRESDLEALAIVDDTIYAIINDWLEKAYLKGRKSTVFFCVSVLHANKMALFLQNQGVSAACVTAETPMDEREDILGRFEEGTLSALCNVAVLTEGWDAPRTDCIALLRPTKSLGLYVQICGRGMRPWPDKDDCLSVNDIDDKNCRECEALKPLPPVSEELETIKDEVGASETIIAAEGNVLSDELGEADIIEVQEAVEFVRAERAVSKNGNDYLKIMFKTEENYWPRSTALMMTMNGKPRAVAEKKWRIMSRGFDLPYSIESAVQMVDRGALLEIKKVNLRKEGRYWNVIGVTF